MSVKILVLCCIVAAAIAEQYSDKYDSIDTDEIVANDFLYEKYFKCLMETGKCTAEGKELRSHMKDALGNGCEKCTEIQKEKTIKVMRFMIENKREHWDELCAKYDPDGTWRKKYEEEAKKHGIEIPKN